MVGGIWIGHKLWRWCTSLGLKETNRTKISWPGTEGSCIPGSVEASYSSMDDLASNLDVFWASYLSRSTSLSCETAVTAFTYSISKKIKWHLSQGTLASGRAQKVVRVLEYKGMTLFPPLIFAFSVCILALVGHFVMLFSAETVPQGLHGNCCGEQR